MSFVSRSLHAPLNVQSNLTSLLHNAHLHRLELNKRLTWVSGRYAPDPRISIYSIAFTCVPGLYSTDALCHSDNCLLCWHNARATLNHWMTGERHQYITPLHLVLMPNLALSKFQSIANWRKGVSLLVGRLWSYDWQTKRQNASWRSKHSRSNNMQPCNHLLLRLKKMQAQIFLLQFWKKKHPDMQEQLNIICIAWQ